MGRLHLSGETVQCKEVSFWFSDDSFQLNVVQLVTLWCLKLAVHPVYSLVVDLVKQLTQEGSCMRSLGAHLMEQHSSGQEVKRMQTRRHLPLSSLPTQDRQSQLPSLPAREPQGLEAPQVLLAFQPWTLLP